MVWLLLPPYPDVFLGLCAWCATVRDIGGQW